MQISPVTPRFEHSASSLQRAAIILSLVNVPMEAVQFQPPRRLPPPPAQINPRPAAPAAPRAVHRRTGGGLQPGTTAAAAGPGSIEQAHTADEWIGLADLEHGAAFYRSILERC